MSEQTQQQIEKQIYIDALNGVGIQKISLNMTREGFVIAEEGKEPCWNQEILWSMKNEDLFTLYRVQCACRLIRQKEKSNDLPSKV